MDCSTWTKGIGERKERGYTSNWPMLRATIKGALFDFIKYFRMTGLLSPKSSENSSFFFAIFFVDLLRPWVVHRVRKCFYFSPNSVFGGLPKRGAPQKKSVPLHRSMRPMRGALVRAMLVNVPFQPTCWIKTKKIQSCICWLLGCLPVVLMNYSAWHEARTPTWQETTRVWNFRSSVSLGWTKDGRWVFDVAG